MDHVVYVDAKAKEMERLLAGAKSMILRGAAGRKMPYGRVNPGDILYLINNNAEGLIKVKTRVKSVLNSEKMTREESIALVEDHQEKLKLTPTQFKRWAGKRYLVLIEIDDVEGVEPFSINKDEFSNMDDWLPVGDIGDVTL